MPPGLSARFRGGAYPEPMDRPKDRMSLLETGKDHWELGVVGFGRKGRLKTGMVQSSDVWNKVI